MEILVDGGSAAGYIGTEMYIMRRVDRREADALGIGNEIVDAYNEVDAGYRVQVEWGIDSLKMK